MYRVNVRQSDIPIHVISFPKLCHDFQVTTFSIIYSICKSRKHHKYLFIISKFINHMKTNQKTWTWVFSQRHQDVSSNFIALEFSSLQNFQIRIDAI